LLPQLKKKLQILTLGIGGVGLVSSYVSYSPEIAARYANFGLIYVRVRVCVFFLKKKKNLMCEMYSTQISTIQSGFFILDIVLY
jgi:hypothetical protein